MVEHQPSKLRVAGSSLVSRSSFQNNDGAFIVLQTLRDSRAHVTQTVEYFLGKEEVTGSSPVVGSSKQQSDVESADS